MKFTISESQGRRIVGFLENYSRAQEQTGDEDLIKELDNEINSIHMRLAHLARRREEKDQGIERSRNGRVQRRG